MDRSTDRARTELRTAQAHIAKAIGQFGQVHSFLLKGEQEWEYVKKVGRLPVRPARVSNRRNIAFDNNVLRLRTDRGALKLVCPPCPLPRRIARPVSATPRQETGRAGTTSRRGGGRKPGRFRAANLLGSHSRVFFASAFFRSGFWPSTRAETPGKPGFPSFQTGK